MAYGDFKDGRTFADKVLRNKAFNFAKDPKYDGYQHGHASMFYTFFDKKNYTDKLLESLIKEKYTHLLMTIFWL